MPYEAIQLAAGDSLRRGLTAADVKAAGRSGEGLLWVDLVGTTHEDTELLRDAFGFHPLALQDCLNERYQRPKVDDYGDYLFITMHGVDYLDASDVVATLELDLFVGRSFVVTAHLRPLPAIEHLFELAQADGRPLRRGAAMLTHHAIDALIDSILPAVDRMEEVADAVEEEAVERPVRELLQAILALKRSALAIHRAMVPEREVLNLISRGQYELLGPETGIYFRDIYDHVGRIEDLSQTLRERADNALSTYLTSVGIRQNETMRVLSIFAAVFLPLSLIAGIYGMNFDYMPELEWRWGYFAVLGLMTLVALAVLAWFWSRRLIGGPRRPARWARRLNVEPAVLREVLAEAARLRDAVVHAATGDRR